MKDIIEKCTYCDVIVLHLSNKGILINKKRRSTGLYPPGKERKIWCEECHIINEHKKGYLLGLNESGPIKIRNWYDKRTNKLYPNQ